MCSSIAFAEDIGSPELPSLGIGRTVIEKGKYYIINEAGEPEENTGDEFNIYYDEKNDTLILKDADINSSFYTSWD